MDTLEQLHKKEMIYARITSTDTVLYYLQPRDDDRTINRFAGDVEKYNQHKSQKLDDMVRLLDTSSCTEQKILKYFGEVDAKLCGRCNYCRKNTKINPSSEITD